MQNNSGINGKMKSGNKHQGDEWDDNDYIENGDEGKHKGQDRKNRKRKRDERRNSPD